MTADNLIGGILTVLLALAFAGISLSLFLMVLDDYRKSNKRKRKK